jgi:hypothetical protein
MLPSSDDDDDIYIKIILKKKKINKRKRIIDGDKTQFPILYNKKKLMAIDI